MGHARGGYGGGGEGWGEEADEGEEVILSQQTIDKMENTI